jgi:DNA (cytosine-5)-methyltransferase 1
VHVLDVCAGYAGLSLGLRIALDGHCKSVCYIEREAYVVSDIVARINEGTLDDAPVWDDVKTFDGRPYRGKVDILTAGYPCQPFSCAGKRRGEDDERHLWPDIERLITEIKPPILFLENVANHLRLGFAEVAESLFALGYIPKPGLFEAAEVGDSQYRRRLFVLAYTPQLGYDRLLHSRRWWAGLEDGFGGLADAGNGQLPQPWSGSQERGRAGSPGEAMGDADSERQLESCRSIGEVGRRIENTGCSVADADGAGRQARSGHAGLSGREFYAGGSNQVLAHGHGSRLAQRTCIGCDDGAQCPQSERTDLPLFPPWYNQYAEWERIWPAVGDAALEPAICRVVDGLANRLDRLRACGNGVVPLEAAYAFRVLATRIVERGWNERHSS